MGSTSSHSEETDMGGMVVWNAAMGIMLIGSIFPFLMTTDYVLKFRGVPLFRGLVMVGALTGVAWSIHWEVRDSLIYFIIIAAVSLIHLAIVAGFQPNNVLDVICKRGKFIHMDPDIDKLYRGKFGGANAIDRFTFCKLTENRATFRTLQKGELYMTHGTDLNSLSILLDGCMEILETVNCDVETEKKSMNGANSQANRARVYVSNLYPMDVINHFEWIARQQGSSNRSHVSIRATQKCRVLEWKREFLHEVFKQFPDLGNCVTSVLGKELAEKTQLLAGGCRRLVSSEFVHHTYCGCGYKQKKQTDSQMVEAAISKHPEFLWETAMVCDMVSNGSYRTLRLTPEQWLMRYAIGDGPWVDLTSDGNKLMRGLHQLMHKAGISQQSRVRDTAQQYLGITLCVTIDPKEGPCYLTLREYQQRSQEAEPQNDDFTVYSHLGQSPFVQVFARMATARIPQDYLQESSSISNANISRRTLESLQASMAPALGASTFGRSSVDSAPALNNGNGNGTELQPVGVSAPEDYATVSTTFPKPVGVPTLIDYVRRLHQDRAGLAQEIANKAPQPGFHERLMQHGAESTDVQALVRRVYLEGIEKEESEGQLQFLCPMRVDKLVSAAQNTMRQRGMRVVNARLLGVDPAMLETSLVPKDRGSLVHGTYHEPLLDFLMKQLPTLHHRDISEMINWGKWRVLYNPGTVWLRQGEFPNYVGVVLDGLVVSFTEDAVTRGRTMTHVIGPGQLIGTEDFQNRDSSNAKKAQLRTARRTIQVPTREMLEQAPPELQKQFSINHQFSDEMAWTEVASTNIHRSYGLEIDPNFMDQIQEVQAQVRAENTTESPGNTDTSLKSQRVTLSRPSVMFVWEFQDLQRMMAADPHLYSALSLMLGFDLSEKRTLAAEDSLGTTWCGVPVHAATDDGVSGGMCGSRADFQALETLDAGVLAQPAAPTPH